MARNDARTTAGWSELRPRGRLVRLVVVEDGASGLEEHASPSGGEHTLVIAQCGGERPMDFAHRTIRCISALDRLQSIVRTILVLSPRFDAEATASRVSLVRVLGAHAAGSSVGSSELLLSAGADLHADLQAKVLALRAALTANPCAGALGITVRFAPDSALSVPPTVSPDSAANTAAANRARIAGPPSSQVVSRRSLRNSAGVG